MVCGQHILEQQAHQQTDGNASNTYQTDNQIHHRTKDGQAAGLILAFGLTPRSGSGTVDYDSVVSSLLRVRQPRLSFLTSVASEVLARFNVRVLLDARLILSDGPKDGHNHPTIVPSRVEQVPILVWIAA